MLRTRTLPLLLGFAALGCDRPQANPYTHDGTFSQLSLSDTQTCALTPKGELRCWKFGPVAEASPPATTWLALSIAPDGEVACGIDGSRALRCFGRCKTTSCPALPGVFTAVSTGDAQGCAIDATSALHCWGWGEKQAPAGRFVQVQVVAARGCAVTSDKRLECFGLLSPGLPTADAGVRWLDLTPPREIQGHVEQVALGTFHTCALLDTKRISCFGDDRDGQLTPPSHSYKAVAAHGRRSCALATDGQIECWGSPITWMGRTFTPPPGNYDELALGGDHACARNATGALICWGVDQQSQVSGKKWQLVRN